MSAYSTYEIPNNYIYFYHTDTVLFIPEYADSVTDNINVQYNSQSILTRTAPIYSYAYSGPRSVQFSFQLHRDLMADLNANNTWRDKETGEDDVDLLIRQIQGAALPTYESATKMVSPPLVAVRMGSDIFIKGIIQGGVGITYKYPIIPGRKLDSSGNWVADSSKQRYSNVDITFNIDEMDPYDANTAMQVGSYRGISTTLEYKIQTAWKKRQSESVQVHSLDYATGIKSYNDSGDH